MGSYINIGLVYSNNIFNINDDIFYIARYLFRFSNKIVINFPKDNFLEEWIETEYIEENGFIEAWKILNTKMFSTGKVYYKVADKEYSIIISIKWKEKVWKGILFEIPEEELLLGDYSYNNLENITAKIINEVILLRNNMRFDYAFCDNEVDIEYSFSEIQEMEKNVYSVLIKTDVFKEPIVELSTWCIDGLTTRKLKRTY